MTLIILIWLIGVFVAWFQIKYWNRDYNISEPEDYRVLTLLSLLSWLIYPIYTFEWFVEHINNE